MKKLLNNKTLGIAGKQESFQRYISEQLSLGNPVVWLYRNVTFRGTVNNPIVSGIPAEIAMTFPRPSVGIASPGVRTPSGLGGAGGSGGASHPGASGSSEQAGPSGRAGPSGGAGLRGSSPNPSGKGVKKPSKKSQAAANKLAALRQKQQGLPPRRI